MPILVKIGTVVLENEMKMWKVYNNNVDKNDNDDNGQILIRKACSELKKGATFSQDVYIFKSDTRAL